MTPERWRHVTAVFHDVLARDATARTAFLEQACAGDVDVRAEVEKLLAAHQGAGQFGEAPVVTLPVEAPTLDFEKAATPHAPQEEADLGAETARRPRNPFIGVVMFAAVLTAAMFSYAAWLLVLQGGAARDFGWLHGRKGGEFFVAVVDPSGPAAGRLAVGDRLIELNGLPPILPGGLGIHRSELEVGDVYRLAIERQGQRLEPTLSVEAGQSELRLRLTYFVMSLVWCVIGLSIGLARPEKPAARLAFGAAVTTGLVFSQGAFSQPVFSFNPLHVILGVHFFARFPLDRPLTGIWRWLLVVMYALAALPLTLQWWVRVVRQTQGASEAIALVLSHQELFAIRGPLPVYLFYASLVLMVTMLARNYRVLSDDNERRRVRWVVIGSIAALSPQIIWSIGELIVGPPAMAWMALPANVLTVGIPLSVAYAVVRHRVLDISVVIRLGVQYLLARRALQAAVALPAVALIYTVFTNRDLTVSALVTDTSGYLYWLAAAGLVLRFRRPIESWLDRRFFREEHDREQFVLGVLEDVRTVESIAELSQLVHDKVASALHPSSVYLWYREPDELAAASSSTPLLTPRDFPLGGRWLSWLEQQGGATLLPRGPGTELTRDDMRWFAGRGVSLVVPMMDAGDRLVGAMLLGSKKSEEPYSDGDRRLLDAIAKQAAVVRENLRLRARVSEDARVRHDVLARLDPRMPDLLKECPLCGACFDGAIEWCSHDGRMLTLSLPVARTVDGKYRLDRLVGKGGMGAVYEARDLRLDRSVAVKIMLGRAFGEQAALRRFRREARAAAGLNHPNIVTVYDVGALEGEGAYLVMEMVRGVTLRAELDRVGTLPPPAAAEWFGPLLDGAAAAHAYGIIHRDLKPENVIGTREGSGSLSVKILDLGLVKFRGGEGVPRATITADGLVMGTPAYMSPEQLLGREVDHRTDIFAVGVMVTEALTGHRPFHGDTYDDLVRAVQQTPHRLPGASPEALALNDLLQRCLAADPAARIASAAALRDALIPLLHDCPSLDLTLRT